MTKEKRKVRLRDVQRRGFNALRLGLVAAKQFVDFCSSMLPVVLSLDAAEVALKKRSSRRSAQL
jgi:hypothetical protein